MAYNEPLAIRIRKLLDGRPGIVEKKMFGGVGFLLNGNMACGVYRDELILRLGEREFAAALRRPYVRIFDITGKPMKGWALVAEGGYKSGKALGDWVAASLAFAGSLPRK